MLQATDAKNTLYSSFCHCMFYITFETGVFVYFYCCFVYFVKLCSAYLTPLFYMNTYTFPAVSQKKKIKLFI